MFKEKKDNLLIFHDVEMVATPLSWSICCHINDDDITDEYYYIPENRYYMREHPNQESDLTWHTENGYFWMTGKIGHPSKITITLGKQK